MINKRKYVNYLLPCVNNWPLTAVLFILALLCFGYNYSTRLGGFPDEVAHLGFISNVIERGFPDYKYGMIYNSEKFNYLEHPALYYIISGFFGKFLLLFHDFSFKYFRLFNYFFSSLSLYFIYRSLNMMKIGKVTILFSFIPMLSVPMFIMLSASMNNDPLMILGCSIFFYSFVIYYRYPNDVSVFMRYLLLGCVITALTKATGSLGIVCILISFVIFNIRETKVILCNLKKTDWLLISLSLIIIISYYGFMLHHFGKFFPSPQENPSFWFRRMYPDAPRMGVIEHLILFFHSNAWTLLEPYGHQSFIDTIYREKLLILTFLLLPILLCVAVYDLYKRRSRYLNMISVFGCAYIIYMILYFMEIHRMNLATGYNGAMQSRYFYGFMPLLVTIYALSINALKNYYFKVIIFSILILTLAFSFYPSWAPLFEGFYGSETGNVNYGGLIKNREFEQTFIAKSNSLHKVEINIGTYQRKNIGKLSLDLLSANKKLLASYTVDMSTISDNSWVDFFYDNVPLLRNATYVLRLTSEDGRPDNVVTWWATGPSQEYPFFKGTHFGPDASGGNRYLEGQASVDGHKVEGTFSFRIFL